jgi:hypothetical protein
MTDTKARNLIHSLSLPNNDLGKRARISARLWLLSLAVIHPYGSTRDSPFQVSIDVLLRLLVVVMASTFGLLLVHSFPNRDCLPNT